MAVASPTCISEALLEIRRMLKEYAHEARVLDPRDAAAICVCLAELTVRARDLEDDVHMTRRQRTAALEGETERVIEAACRPGSNVRLFPAISRPFTDGRPGGAA